VGELVFWYGMFAPCGAFLGNHGLSPWGSISQAMFQHRHHLPYNPKKPPLSKADFLTQGLIETVPEKPITTLKNKEK